MTPSLVVWVTLRLWEYWQMKYWKCQNCTHAFESLCPCIHLRMLPTHCIVASALVDRFLFFSGKCLRLTYFLTGSPQCLTVVLSILKISLCNILFSVPLRPSNFYALLAGIRLYNWIYLIFFVRTRTLLLTFGPNVLTVNQLTSGYTIQLILCIIWVETCTLCIKK